MPRRATITEKARQEILLKSKRRCALCFAHGLEVPQEGALARIDSSPLNDDSDNLVFLCLNHHMQFDRGALDKEDLVGKRASLYKALASEEDASAGSASASRDFEDEVVEFIRNSHIERLGDFFALRRNELLIGHSGVAHEVDVATEFRIGTFKYLTVFEVKFRNNPVSTQDVLEFGARSIDIGADKAVMVCNAGFSHAAIRLATNQRIGLIMLDRRAGQLVEIREVE